jgi:sensor histidine kinase YesM
VAFDIPPLLLQPLVENAVRHGLEDGQKLSIRLNVQQDSEGSVMLSVEDNGPGILPEAQEKLLRGEGDGIGFTNVLKRVSLIRGASIHIDSAPGEGTRIIITFRRKES